MVPSRSAAAESRSLGLTRLIDATCRGWHSASHDVARRSSLVAVALTAGSLSSGADAIAACPTSGWTAGIPTRLGPDQLPFHNGDGGYNNDETYTWDLHFDQFVSRANFYAGPFATELTYDRLCVTDVASNIVCMSGTVGPAWMLAEHVTSTSSSNASRLTVDWHADETVTVPGSQPSLSQVRVRCFGGLAALVSQPIVMTDRETQGILRETGSVIYFNYFQPAGRELRVSLLNRAATAGANFDLYALRQRVQRRRVPQRPVRRARARLVSDRQLRNVAQLSTHGRERHARGFVQQPHRPDVLGPSQPISLN